MWQFSGGSDGNTPIDQQNFCWLTRQGPVDFLFCPAGFFVLSSRVFCFVRKNFLRSKARALIPRSSIRGSVNHADLKKKAELTRRVSDCLTAEFLLHASRSNQSEI